MSAAAMKLDRKVPLTWLLASAAAGLSLLVTGTAQVTTANSRLGAIETTNTRQDAQLDRLQRLIEEQAAAGVLDRLAIARIEEQGKAQTEVLRDIRQQLRSRP